MEALNIVTVPLPFTGHVSVLMHLSTSLVSIGFNVTVLCPNEAYESAVRACDSEHSKKIRVVQVGEIPASGVCGDVRDKMGVFPAWMKLQVEHFLANQAKEGNPVNCILGDALLAWVQDVANSFNIPRAVLITSSAINDLFQIYLPQLITAGFVPTSSFEGKHENELIDFIPGISPMPVSDLPMFFDGKSPVLKTLTTASYRFHEAEFALCNTFEELEGHSLSCIHREVKANYYCAGPCVSGDFLLDECALKTKRNSLTEMDRNCLEWLDKQAQSSVIYTSFGSLATFSFEQIKEVAQGLEDAGHPFLLVIREGLVSTRDATIFFNEFVKGTEGRGLVVPWSPQMQVLLHRAVGGFITHCGWSSVLEAICGGVPMLGWPQIAEQNVNCREIVGRLKIGIEVKGKEAGGFVSKNDINMLVARLMGEEGNEMRRTACQLRNKARNALSDGGSSHQNLKLFAGALRQHVTSRARFL